MLGAGDILNMRQRAGGSFPLALSLKKNGPTVITVRTVFLLVLKPNPYGEAAFVEERFV